MRVTDAQVGGATRQNSGLKLDLCRADEATHRVFPYTKSSRQSPNVLHVPKFPWPELLTQPGNPSPSALVSPAESLSAVNPLNVPRLASQLRVPFCGFNIMPR